MTRKVICVSRDLGVESLMALLLHRGVSRVPVVDEFGRLIGIVSKTDLLRETLETEGLVEYELDHATACPSSEDELGQGWVHARDVVKTAGDIMMPVVFRLPVLIHRIRTAQPISQILQCHALL